MYGYIQQTNHWYDLLKAQRKHVETTLHELFIQHKVRRTKTSTQKFDAKLKSLWERWEEDAIPMTVLFESVASIILNSIN